MGELMAAMTLEVEEGDLLVYCVSRNTMNIFRERKDTYDVLEIFRVSTDIFQIIVI